MTWNIPFSVEPWEVKDGQKVFIEEFEGIAEVVCNNPRYIEDLDFDIYGYKVRGFLKGPHGKCLPDVIHIDAPEWLVVLFDQYQDNIQDQIFDELIAKLQLLPSSYPMQAGRSL